MTELKETSLSRLMGYLFLGAMAVGTFFPLAFVAVTPLLGLVSTGLFYKATGKLPQFDHSIMLAVLILCGLLFASSLWSVTPAASLERALKVGIPTILSCSLLFLCKELSQHNLVVFKKWAIVPLLVLAAYLSIELKYDYPLFRFVRGIPDDVHISAANLNKHVATLVLLSPFGIFFSLQSRHITLPILLIFLCALVLSVTESQSAQLSAFIMIVSVPVLLLMPSAGTVLVFLAAGFLVVFMPWIGPIAFDAVADVLAQKNTALSHANMSMRLENWDFLGRRIMENPWTGFGADTTRAMRFDTEQLYFKSDMILHPHNIALQMWIEFGVAGSVLALSLLGFIYRRLTALSLTSRILPFALFCGIMVFLMVSWSAWAGWLDGLILWILALLILVTKPRTAQPTS